MYLRTSANLMATRGGSFKSPNISFLLFGDFAKLILRYKKKAVPFWKLIHHRLRVFFDNKLPSTIVLDQVVQLNQAAM